MAKDPTDRLNKDDPSGLKATEDRRAAELEKDLDAVAKRIVLICKERKVTDAVGIQYIVDEEMAAFNDESKAKVLRWVEDTMMRGTWWAEALVTGSSIRTIAKLGPRPLSQDLKDALRVAVGNDIDSLSVDAKKILTRTISDGIERGKGIQDIAREVQENLSTTRARANTIARTETLNAFRRATKESYERHEVERVRWLTSARAFACDECQALDGQEFDIDDVPLTHGGSGINCRCVTVPVKRDPKKLAASGQI